MFTNQTPHPTPSIHYPPDLSHPLPPNASAIIPASNAAPSHLLHPAPQKSEPKAVTYALLDLHDLYLLYVWEHVVITVHASALGWRVAIGTGCSPAEWISSALRRCQEDKWAVCFCLAIALRHLLQNGSFCTAGCLSVTDTPFISYKVSDPACVGFLVSWDVSAQFEGQSRERITTPTRGVAYVIIVLSPQYVDVD